MMSLFFTLGWIIHDWLWSKNGPFWTKKGQTWQACQHSKVVQKGLKGTKMVSLSVFDHQEPFWAHLDPFGPFQTRIDILLRSTSVKPYFVHLGQKIHFRLKWSKRGQISPKGRGLRDVLEFPQKNGRQSIGPQRHQLFPGRPAFWHLVLLSLARCSIGERYQSSSSAKHFISACAMHSVERQCSCKSKC